LIFAIMCYQEIGRGRCPGAADALV
jgi:hypothetical protein